MNNKSAVKSCTDMINELKNIIVQLQLAYADLAKASDAEFDMSIINQLNAKRQALTSELYKSLPSPLHESMVKDVTQLQESIETLKSSIISIQKESSDELMRIQSHTKARKAYSQF